MASVLLIEDDQRIRQALASTLAEMGHEMRSAATGMGGIQEAVAAAPDVVVLDLGLPDMDGSEVLKMIRSVSTVPVIIATAQDDEAGIVKLLDLGADDYVRKPFDTDELFARIRAAQRLIEVQEHLRSQATRDDLTGTLNRAAIMDVLRRTLEQARQDDSPVSILLVDIDRFKPINDTYGHLTGDAALRRIGGMLQTTLRLYDTVGRYGGEEFLIILPECPPQDAVDVAERLRAHVGSRRIPTAAGALFVTVSVGVGTKAGVTCEPDDLIERADRALYQAKHAGRNRVAGPLDALAVLSADRVPLHGVASDPTSAHTESSAAGPF